MDYARHIERICKIEDIEIQIYTGAGRGDRRRRRIKIKPVRGPVSYAIALHEIGHVLGNRHIEAGVCPICQTPPTTVGCDFNNIMTCCGTGSIPAGTLPIFNTDQINRIVDSDLTQLFED